MFRSQDRMPVAGAMQCFGRKPARAWCSLECIDRFIDPSHPPAPWAAIEQIKPSSMSTHLVETSEEDSFTAVSRHLSELLNKGQVSATSR